MRKSVKLSLLLIVLLSAAGLYSCEKINSESTKKGTASFSIALPSNVTAKSLQASDSSNNSLQILVTITDNNSNAVFTDKAIPFYLFGTEYVSDNIEIKSGDFKLTKFMVVNSLGEVIYATPLEGSSLAYLCTRPLPMAFTIKPGEATKIVPEVLAVGNQTPSQFGYATFGMQIITPLEFWIACTNYPSVSATQSQYISASLTVFSLNGWSHTFMLDSAVNNLFIQAGSDVYTLVAQRAGYPDQKVQVTAAELAATTKDKPYVLGFPPPSMMKTIVIQPGPETGKDAMISNLEPDTNFGDYKYFEATYLTEPLLTVMRSNRSLIAFNLDSIPKTAVVLSAVLTLSYDIPVPFDNTVFMTDSIPAGTVWYGGVLQQIVEPWDEAKVTWNNQPKTIETGEVFIAPFIRNVNFINVDVTRLINPITASALPNYGMMFRLWPMDKFPGFRFGSGDYPDVKLRPMLTITYRM